MDERLSWFVRGGALALALYALGTSCATPPGPTENTFPLIGQHEPLDCFACHGDLPYGAAPSDCAGCHIGARPDPHYEGDCGDCHTPMGWLDLDVAHDFYPLIGSHASLPCVACHADGYQGTPNTCSACHEPVRPAVHDPGDCGDCHQPTRWADVSIDHSFFPLTGGHSQPGCSECHTNGTYDGLSPQCESCHLPDRPASHYPGACDSCHNINSWGDVTIDHSFFPLRGGHQGLSCTRCHTNGTYQGLSSTCADCHMADALAEADEHTFPIGPCDNCHTIYTFDR